MAKSAAQRNVLNELDITSVLYGSVVVSARYAVDWCARPTRRSVMPTTRRSLGTRVTIYLHHVVEVRHRPAAGGIFYRVR